MTVVPIVSWGRADVNILTWWGYLDATSISHIEKTCGARISIDEYYSNTEFHRRAQQESYDIVIYSQTELVRFKPRKHGANNSFAAELAAGYQPSIAQRYALGGYPSNTAFFQLTLTGFLWVPKNISLDETDTIGDLFRKAKGKTVVLVDDYNEVMSLVSKVDKHPPQGAPQTTTGFHELLPLLDGINVVITPNLGDIVEKDDFAFAFTWSGEALEKMSQSKRPLRFMVHPLLSHWGADLLTLASDTNSARCVAKELAGERFVENLSTRSFYFSPYGKTYLHHTDSYRDLMKRFHRDIVSIPKLHVAPDVGETRVEEEWADFKMKLRMKAE